MRQAEPYGSRLAKETRKARDAILNNVPEEDLGEPPVAGGEHNRTAGFGFDLLPPTIPPLMIKCFGTGAPCRVVRLDANGSG
jgi:hypothetical protein